MHAQFQSGCLSSRVHTKFPVAEASLKRLINIFIILNKENYRGDFNCMDDYHHYSFCLTFGKIICKTPTSQTFKDQKGALISVVLCESSKQTKYCTHQEDATNRHDFQTNMTESNDSLWWIGEWVKSNHMKSMITYCLELPKSCLMLSVSISAVKFCRRGSIWDGSTLSGYVYYGQMWKYFKLF